MDCFSNGGSRDVILRPGGIGVGRKGEQWVNVRSDLYYFAVSLNEDANSQLCGFHDFHSDPCAVICRPSWHGYLILTQPIRRPFRS